MADSSDLSCEVLDKLRSLETKMTTVERELSAVKLDHQRFHDAVADISQTLKRLEFPRVHELRFPEYDGSVDPDLWLHRCELFFRLQRTEDNDKVWLAGFHMTGKAQIWYCQFERNYCRIHTWPELAEAVRLEFGFQTSGKTPTSHSLYY